MVRSSLFLGEFPAVRIDARDGQESVEIVSLLWCFRQQVWPWVSAATVMSILRHRAISMFIPPMWSDEVERIGKQRCTPSGYILHGIGDLVGFIGFLMLVVGMCYVGYRGLARTSGSAVIWIIGIPIAIGVLGSSIVRYSWRLAYRKKFHYDYERRESSWFEAGERRVYTFEDWMADRRGG